jgi:ATP-binding cassette subfamily B protein
MLLVSLAETISIGTFFPFLGILTSPETVFSHKLVQPVIKLFDLTEPHQLLLPLTIAFALAVMLAGVLRLILIWASTRLSFSAGADLSMDIYRRTLYQPYKVHCERNSSEVINGVIVKTNTVIQGITALLTMVASSVMLLFIVLALLFLDSFATLATICGFGLLYGFIIKSTGRQLFANSLRGAQESTKVIRALQEGLGGIRDIIIDGSQEVYCRHYRDADLPLRRAQGGNEIIVASPRFAIEALGLVMISALAYTLALQPGYYADVIPVLGTLALGIQRLLPVLQQLYAAWSSLRGGQASFQDAINLLGQPLPNHENIGVTQKLSFHQSFSLRQIGFCYGEQGPSILKNLNLTITKGSRIGFIGKTGSGKSTLLDIVMALLEPTEGALEVDGVVITSSNRRAWQAHIAHVPQTIFLADTSISENIAFGVPKSDIDYHRVRNVAQKAQIADEIESWQEKYKTVVGERGIRLSGGQRQRIGIARALYKEADVIIFDEATSALDDKTEKAIIQVIESLSQDLTLLMISHRITTLKSCTEIIELENGHIKRVGTYQDLNNRATLHPSI